MQQLLLMDSLTELSRTLVMSVIDHASSALVRGFVARVCFGGRVTEYRPERPLLHAPELMIRVELDELESGLVVRSEWQWP